MCAQLFMGTHLRAMEHHLTYGITQTDTLFHATQYKHAHLNSSQTGWCRGKFVAPGKFFPPPYSHDVTNHNPNPTPNPNHNHNLNLIPYLNPNPYYCMWELFSGATHFTLHRYSIYLPQKDRRLS